MDVTCERCGTEYEFDETLVAARGTTVKCTNCGHLFKVFRPGASAAGGVESKSWTVRRAGGASESIASLKELQRLITVGQLTPDDQISRSGEGWKRLGDIAELQTFFAAAAAARESQRPARRDPTGGRVTDGRAYAPTGEVARGTDRPPPQSAPLPRAGKSTMMGVGALPGGAPAGLAHATHGEGDVRGRTIEVAVPPPANAHPSSAGGVPAGAKATSPGGARAPSDRPVPRAAPPSSRPPPPPPPPSHSAPPSHGPPSHGPPSHGAPLPPPPRTPSETISERPPPRVRTRVQESVPPPAPGGTRPSDRPSVRPLHVDDDDDVPLRPAARSRSGLWVGLVVLLAIGAGVAMGWDRIVGLVESAGAGDPAEPFVAAGDDALRADHEDGYEEAIAQYTKALAHREHDARALTGLSRAHALIAQSQIFAASDLEGRAGEDAAMRGEAAGLRRESADHAETAREHAEEAARHGPGGTPAAQADTEVALSDALRLAGDRQLAQSRLDRARTLSAEPTAESLRVEALLVSDVAGTPSAGREIAERAVQADPGLIRARLVLARALLSAGDVAAARAQLQAVIDRAPEHPHALALREAIDQGLPPAAPVVAAPDAGAPAEAVAPAVAPTVEPVVAPPPPTETPTPPTDPSAGRTAPTTATAAAPTGEYDDLVRSGQQRLENGDARGARRFFESALRGRPGGTEASVGMGYVLLAEGNARGALSQFEGAAGRGYVEAHIGIADAQRRLGDRRAALAAYERYLEVAPGGRSASIAQRQAQRLRDELGTAAAGGTTTTERHEGGSSTTTTTPTEGAPDAPREELPAPREPEPAPAPAPAPAPTEDRPAIDSEP